MFTNLVLIYFNHRQYNQLSRRHGVLQMSGTTKRGEQTNRLILQILKTSVKRTVPDQWQLHCIVRYM